MDSQISGWDGVGLTSPANISYTLIFQELEKPRKENKVTQEKVCASTLNYGNGSQVASGTQFKDVTLSEISGMKRPDQDRLAVVKQRASGNPKWEGPTASQLQAQAGWIPC